MKNSNRYTLLASSLLLLLVASCGEEKKKDAQEAILQEEFAGKEVEPQVLMENKYAKVVKIVLAPGDFQAAHEGEDRVIYSLTDYSIGWEEKGVNLGTKSWKAGDAHFHEAGEHAANNTGTTTAEWLVFSKKSNELPECADNTLENDVSTVAPEFTMLLFENDDFRMVEVTLPKGEKIPLHAGINRIIYSLSDYQIMYESDSEGSGAKEFKKGSVHWHEACKHALTNIGDTEANFLVVSYKNKG